MDITFTDHAEYQLKERRVEKVWVEDTINSPDITKTIKNKYYVIKKLNGKELKVVYLKEKHIKVITLFWIK